MKPQLIKLYEIWCTMLKDFNVYLEYTRKTYAFSFYHFKIYRHLHISI